METSPERLDQHATAGGMAEAPLELRESLEEVTAPCRGCVMAGCCCLPTPPRCSAGPSGPSSPHRLIPAVPARGLLADLLADALLPLAPLCADERQALLRWEAQEARGDGRAASEFKL